MARETFYRQCILERDNPEGGKVQTTTWIPERYEGTEIKPGVTMKIKRHGSEEWEDGRWTVASVGTSRKPEKAVKERAHNWTKYREHTDV